MTALAVETLPETADLDLLDDPTEHGICLKCYPNHQPGIPYVAVCGKRALDFGPILDYIPPNACPACLPFKRCPKCGHVFGSEQ